MRKLKLVMLALAFTSVISCHLTDGSKENKITVFAISTQDEGWRKDARKMVADQLRSRGIADPRVLKAMEETPRHLFVPVDYRPLAYNDNPLPIGQGQTISQPYIVAFMTELLGLKAHEKVLEIGTGSGYQAAILSQLVNEVYSVEIVKSLADSSKALLSRLGYKNVVVKHGDGYQGWEEHAPFDAVIVTAAPDEAPSKLIDQMKLGGRMVLPVGTHAQQLKVITKSQDGEIKERFEAWVRFVPMVHPSDSTLRDSNK